MTVLWFWRECPHCHRDMGSSFHGICQECGRYCGCSFNPESMNDYCRNHNPWLRKVERKLDGEQAETESF